MRTGLDSIGESILGAGSQNIAGQTPKSHFLNEKKEHFLNPTSFLYFPSLFSFLFSFKPTAPGVPR